MAFSYSDENFTVVGNLCFVHIMTTTTGEKSINIPPALADRMLIDNYSIVAVSSIGRDNVPIFVMVEDKKITFYSSKEITYINFSFPINSNK